MSFLLFKQVDLGDYGRGVVTGIKTQGSSPDKRVKTFKVKTGLSECALSYVTETNGAVKVNFLNISKV